MAIVWQFCSYKALNESEKIQKRCLTIILDDNVSDCKTLLERSGKKTESLATHIPEIIDNVKLNFMKNIFTLK